jgi:hypothetical protein
MRCFRWNRLQGFRPYRVFLAFLWHSWDTILQLPGGAVKEEAMRKLGGVVLMIVSLVCISVTVAAVALGKAGLWSAPAIGAYVFHPLTMAMAMWLLAGKGREPLPEATKEGGA